MDMEAGKTLTNEEVIRELLELLKKNAMKEQANDVFEICSYVDGLEKKIDSMTEELTNMQNQIKEMQEDTLVNNAKKALSEAQERLNARCEQIKSQVLEVKAQVKSTAKSIVDEAKVKGRAALYRVSEFLGIKKRLLDIRENVRGAIKTTDKDIAKTALLAKGFREAGQTAANAFRTFADKPEVDYSQKEQKHPITKAVLAPMKAVRKLLVSMELHLDASIDKLDNLAMNVQIDKEKRVENTKSEKQNVPDRAEAEPERVNAEIVYTPMVAEAHEYQYNADAFEARGTATKAAATAAGTAVAPGVGTAIGMAAGYAAGVSIEVKDEKMTNRSRKIKFFLDKMKAQENQTDSVAKLVKDLIVRKAITWVKAAAPIIGLVLLLLVLVVAMIAVPVIAVIAILYNSPFALFLPPLESGDTVQTVTSAYVQEFNRDVNTKVNEHTGYDLGELVYVDYEGMEENPSNYYDIMAVYMVKHGVGDTATVMNDTSKGWLQAVVNDMCSYTTSTGTKDVEETDADGNVTTVTKSVLYVNVTLKSYRDMISVYGFNSDHVEMLEQIMSPEFMGQLGYAGSGSGGGGGSPGVSSMTEDEINAILSGITDSRQKTVCSYALHRVGFPYSQDLRDSGNYYDCSSLAYYSWKDAGVDISYGGATTAAAEAQGLDEAGKTVSFDELQPGDLIFYSFTCNGRYKNISHVAVYVGNGKVVEALNESLGVVYRDVASTGKIVVIGRP